MKYSIGQKVITCEFHDDPSGLCFNDNMEYYIGSAGVITGVEINLKQYLVHGWWWPEEALELVESETSAEPPAAPDPELLDLTKILHVGDKIYSAMQGDVEVASLQDDIRCKDVTGNIYRYYKDGCRLTTGECVLFPSRDNRDWSKFKRNPDLKKGDIVKVWDNDGPEPYIRVFSHFAPLGEVCTYNDNYCTQAWQHAEKISVDELKDFE